jgi:WD40 repeat protein
MRIAAALCLLTCVSACDYAFSAEPTTPHRVDANGDPMPAKAVLRLGSVRFQLQELDRGFVSDRDRHWVIDREHAVALSPDGSTIVVPGMTHTFETPLYFIDTRTGKCRRGPTVAKVQARQIRFGPDSKTLMLMGWGTIALADIATGHVAKSFEFKDSRGPLAISADGKWVAGQVGKDEVDAGVVVLEAETQKQIAKLPGRGASCQQIAFSADAMRILLASMIPERRPDGQLWYSNLSKLALSCLDIAECKIIGSKEIGYSQRIAFASDGETVAIEAENHSNVDIVHLPSNTKRCAIDVSSQEFVFTPDGKSIVTIDGDRQCSLWDSATGKKVRDLDGALANRDSRVLGISQDGKVIAAVDGGWASTPTIVVWQAQTGKRMNRPPGHEGAVTSLAYTSDGRHIISGSVDRTVRLWNSSRGEHVRIIASHKEPITAIAISADDSLVATSSESGELRVSRIADDATVAELAGLPKGAQALAFSADGSMVLAGTKSPEVFAWNIATRERIAPAKVRRDGEIMDLAKGGGLLAVGNSWFRGEKMTIELWKPSDPQPMATITIGGQEKNGDVRCERVVISPDRRLLVSSQISEFQGIRPSYGEAKLRVWECSTGQAIRTLAPTITKVVAFSPNGRFLASGGTGRSGHLSVGYGPDIVIWDAATGDNVGEIADAPNCVAFSPNGRHLASAGRDGSILIWETPGPRTPCNAKVSDDVRDSWWPALGEDAKLAYEAIAQMLDSPEQGTALLRQRVQPIQHGDADLIAKLVKQLDSAKFAEREIAQRELIKLGEGTLEFLSKALKVESSAEARRRLEDVVAKVEGNTTHTLRHHRAVAALEWIGTPTAKEHMQTLAKGAPGARLTIEAEAALRRMGKSDVSK